MNEDTEIVSNMVRDGKYFDASRSWYQTIYIGPIAERSFFLVVAGLSIFVAIFASLGFSGAKRPIAVYQCASWLSARR